MKFTTVVQYCNDLIFACLKNRCDWVFKADFTCELKDSLIHVHSIKERKMAMKNLTLFSATLIVLVIFTCGMLPAQVIFSRFDFNAVPYTNATIGPNATSIDADVTGDGAAVFIDANCGALKGIDLAIPNTASIFDQAEMGMTFRFLKLESRSDFFLRGGTNFYQSGNNLWISYRTSDGGAGFIDYGPYNTGFTLVEDGFFHEYTFIYVAGTGIATVSVDGLTVWTQDGPDSRDLYWVGAPDPIVGSVMDGNCSGIAFLDYAYFFIPIDPLPINFHSFEATAVGAEAILNWTAENAPLGIDFNIERSSDGIHFETIGATEGSVALGSQDFAFTDPQPGIGLHYYRVVQESGDGGFSRSEIRTVNFVGNDAPELSIWPNPVNPSQQQLHFSIANVGQSALIKIFDVHGKIVAEMPQAASGTIDAQRFAPGIYFLNCECSGARLMEKLIVR
jgi:hypothetical protein